MGLIEEYTAAQDFALKSKCQVSAVAYALNIVKGESTNTPNHFNRARYANNLVANPSQFAAQLALGVIALLAASDPTTISDTDINNAIATNWDMYAGII